MQRAAIIPPVVVPLSPRHCQSKRRRNAEMYDLNEPLIKIITNAAVALSIRPSTLVHGVLRHNATVNRSAAAPQRRSVEAQTASSKLQQTSEVLSCG